MSQKIKHINRKGTPYYFREVAGKRGVKIVCSQTESENDLAAIPDTHEIAKFAIKFRTDPAGIKAITEGILRYEPVLKLELADKETRRFSIHRMCWMDRAEWIFLKEGGLHALLEEYVPHIGQESFYELF